MLSLGTRCFSKPKLYNKKIIYVLFHFFFFLIQNTADFNKNIYLDRFFFFVAC